MTKALFGGGCFWGIEEFFRNISGVSDTKVGYAGGTLENPKYEDVCTGKTQHAEVVEIEFDINNLSYEQLIEHFWKCHDPTQLNKQGPDIGTQYRSIIFFYNKEQKDIAETSKLNNQKFFKEKIVTEITEFKNFFLAEDYHQMFLKKRG